ncbi:MAG: NADH-quinone oxidoreductase subunit C [Anaerolineales bacterium]|nr:NADH-quinone oxidoreductase subunit C [Anaerolineales bacterium]
MRTTEEILYIAEELAAGWAWDTSTTKPEPNRLDVFVKYLEDLVPIAVGLRVQGLGYLAAITGLDHGPEADILEALYHFCTGKVVVTLRVNLPRRSPVVPTMTNIIPGAEAFERELSEMFGVEIDGLEHPSHLYLPDDMPVDLYPLRKDVHVQDIVARLKV